MQTASEADITRRVNEYAGQVAAATGSTLANPAASSAPCEGTRGEMDESIRTVQGVYNISVAPDKHLETLARLRDQWRSQGWTITEDRTFPNGSEGTITATTTPDDYSLTVSGTREPTALLLLVHSWSTPPATSPPNRSDATAAQRASADCRRDAHKLCAGRPASSVSVRDIGRLSAPRHDARQLRRRLAELDAQW